MGAVSRTVTLKLLGNSKDVQAAIDRTNTAADALEKRGVTVNIVADTADSETSIQSVSAALDRYNAAAAKAAETASALGDASVRVTETTQAQTEATQAQADAQARIAELNADSTAGAAELTEAYARLGAANTAVAGTTKDATEARAQYTTALSANTEASLASMDAQARLGAADLEGATSAKVAADSQEKLAVKTDAAGASAESSRKKLGMLSLGIVAAAAGSVYLAAKFQSTMTTLATQAGVPKSQIAGLSSGVVSLAGKVGFSPDSLAMALYHVESSFASVGIKGPQALNLVKIAAEGAAVGHANLVDVTNALDATIVAGVPGVKSFSGAMGALNAVVGSGDMQMEDLAEAMGTGVMAVAKSFGQSIYQVGAALAVFGDNNIRGAKAATDLRMAWQAMAAPTAAGISQLKKLGLTSTELGNTMEHHGLSAAIGQFIQHLKDSNVPVSDWGEMMTNIFGKKAGVGVGILVDQFSRLQSKFPDLEKGANGFGSAWTQTQKTTTQQFNQLKSGLDALAINIGSTLLPPLKSLLGPVEKFVGFLASSAPARNIVLGIAAAFTVAFIAVKSIVAATELWKDAMEVVDLLSLDNPIVLIVAGVILLGVVIYELVTRCKVFRDFWIDAWHDVWDIGKAVFDWIKNNWPLLATILLGPVGLAVAEIIKHWGDIQHGIEAVFHWISYNWHLVLAILTGPIGLAVDAITVHWHAVQTGLKAVLSWIDTGWSAVYGFTVGPIKLAVALIKGWWTTEIWNPLKTVYGWINTAWSAVTGFLTKPVLAAVNLIRGYWNTELSDVKTLIGDIKNAFSPAATWLYNAGKDLILGLYHGAEDYINGVGGWVAGIGGKIVDAVKNFFGIHSPSTVFAQLGQYMMMGLVKGMIGGSSGLVDRVFGGMANALVGVLGKGLLSLNDLPSKVLSSLGTILGQLPGFMSGLAGDVGGLFGGSSGGGGGGVSKYASTITNVLSLLHQPASLLGDVEHRMNQESGGQPTVVNKTDSNWQAGHPSVGLMQVIAGTFDAYAGPFRNTGPFSYGVSTNPLANIFAGLNYAEHAYPSIAYAMMKPGGYQLGGLISEPIFGIGASGRSYTFGENGTQEWVSPLHSNAGPSSGNTYNINVQPGPLAHPADIGREVVTAIKQFEKRSGASWRGSN